MKYELEMFDHFVSIKLAEDVDFIERLSESNLPLWKERLSIKKKRLKKCIIELAFSSTRDKIIERNIQAYQIKLINLANRITYNIKNAEVKPNKYASQLQTYTRDCILSLLTL